MEVSDEDGAAAAASYYLLLFPYVFASGDLTEWEALAHPDCTFCTGVIADVETMASEGYRAEGGLFEVSAVRARSVTPGHWYAVEVEAIQSASTTVDSTGAVVEDFAGPKPVWIDAAVVYEDGRWLIREFTPREVE